MSQAETLAPEEPDLLQGKPGADFDLSEYLARARRWWNLVAATCLVAMTGGAIHYLLTPKTFRSTATIQIERHTLARTLSTQAPWLESFADPEYYPTAYKQLTSRGLAERVIRRLGLLPDPARNAPGSGDVTRAGAHDAAAGDDEVLGVLADRLRAHLGVEPVPRTQLVEISYQDASIARRARAAASATIPIIPTTLTRPRSKPEAPPGDRRSRRCRRRPPGRAALDTRTSRPASG